MKLRVLLTIGGVLALVGCGPKADSPKKALMGATLIDGTGAAALSSSVILIDAAMITVIGPGTSTAVPQGFEKVNVAGKFIVPGLIDAHVSLDSDATKATAQMNAYLAAGITSVGADEKGGAHVFSSLGKRAGVADLVIASNGSRPDATMAKIERMAKAEIAPAQIIQAATLNAAVWLEQKDLGTIRAGHRADLLVLNADPLSDIKNLKQIYRVMVDGHWVTPSK